MKKILFLVLIATLFLSCEQAEQRYFGESAETATLEAGIAAYESGDWEQWRSHFADTAKIYVNSTEAMSLDDRVNQLTEMTTAWADYGFNKDDDHIEMVVDKLDETWVYYWATHSGSLKANNKKLEIPVHLAVRFEGGKIVAEHVYFDATELNAEMAALAAAAEAAESAEDDSGDSPE